MPLNHPPHSFHSPRSPGRRPRTPRRAQWGFSYIEVVVATGLVIVTLVPALDALRSGILGSAVHATEAGSQARLRAKMEEVLARPFTSLYALTYATGGNSPTSIEATLSDPAGPERRIVTLYRADGAIATAADTGLLRIRVAFEAGGTPLETLTGRWW